MKYRMFILIILLFGGISASKAQGYIENPNILKWNPLSLIPFTYTFSYERMLSQRISLQGTLNYTYDKEGSNGTGSSEKRILQGYGIVPELRSYLDPWRDKPAQGPYFSMFIRYQSFSERNYTDIQIPSETGNSSLGIATAWMKMVKRGLGSTIGYQELIGSNIIIDVFAGPEFVLYSKTIIRQDAYSRTDLLFLPNSYPVLGVRAGLRVGVVF